MKGVIRAAGIAGRALWSEVAGFRFDFPARPVPEAALPGALRYHLDAPDLFHGAMLLDGDGVPYHESRTFRSYNPAYVALYGLRALDAFARGTDPNGRRRFEQQVAWLRSHAVPGAAGGAVWPYDFEWREHDCVLRPPWISSMAQGLAISALVRAHRVMQVADDLALARAAAVPFAHDIADGGVRDQLSRGATYEEYASLPVTRVLDGFLFSLLGLHDLATETADAGVRALFDAGLTGLAAELPRWDAGNWSWYGRRLYLAPPAYHAINRALLTAVAQVAADPALLAVAERWNPVRLSAAERASVYLRFVAGKQWSRVRDRVIVWPAVRAREAREGRSPG
ncbi:MAG: hypothetical protein HYX65_13010 [Gemmatimonadetes bacterium]|nr:hypothetical protein [Gemmatimonadota bacterium]